MPSHMRSLSSARVGRAASTSLRLAFCLALAAVAGCGGAQSAPKQAEPQGGVASVQELERRVRTGDARGAAALAASLRSQGPVAPRVLALESLARWSLRDEAGARAAADVLVERAAAGDREALLATEQLVTAYLAARRDAEAMRVTAPLFVGGCTSHAVCAFGLRLLVSASLSDDALFQRAQAMAPPPAQDAARQRWILALARSLADAGRDPAHVMLVRARLAAQPGDPLAWAALLYRAPRSRGNAVRDAWLQELRGARLPPEALRAVLQQPEVATDPLLRNDLYGLLCERPDATSDDWATRVAAAGQSATRRSDPRARALLTDLAASAPPHLPDATSRRGLIGALLAAGLADRAATLLAPLLAEVPAHRETLVLHAERLRQAGDVEGAKNAAKDAVAADPARAGETAALLAAQWMGVWPEQAHSWTEVAARSGGKNDDVSVRTRAMHLLGSYQPPTNAEVDLRAYAVLLLRDLARPTSQQVARAELRQHVDKLGSLLPRGAWLGVAADALVQLCVAPGAEARTCELASEGRIRQRDRDEGLRLWAQARSLVGASPGPLQPEGTAAVWAHVGDARGLAAWLRLSEVRSVADLQLSWRIALTLLGGGELLMARPWIADTLARAAGTDVLLATLTPARTETQGAAPHLRIAEAELEVVARSGGADLVLSHIDVLRKAAVGRGEVGADWRFARVQAIALATLGRGEEAHRLFERIAALADLDDRQRSELAHLAVRLHHCDVALDVATTLAPNRWTEARPVVLGAVRCGQSSQDHVRLGRLADRIAKAHIELSVQLEFAQMLAHHGAGKLAAVWYQRLLGPSRGQVNIGYQLEWAEVLLNLGRPGEADEVIEQLVTRNRGQAMAVGARNGARLLIMFERVEAAIILLDRAIAIENHMELQLLRQECLLRVGDVAGLAGSLEQRARTGLERAALDQLLKIARATQTMVVLHQALQGLQDVDRDVERFRLEVAAAVQDGAALDGAVQRLRARGVPPLPVAARAQAAQGRWQRGRGMAEELLAGGDGGAASVRDEDSALDAALAVRRDPTSVAEAVALGRLALARSTEPTLLALSAAGTMAQAGAADAAMALVGHAVEAHGDNPMVLVHASAVAMLAGRRDEARRYWQRVTARTLAEPNRAENRGSAEGVPEEIALLRNQLVRAGDTELLRRWLPLWIDQRPHLHDLWAQWIRADVDAGEPAVGLEHLLRADRELNAWPDEHMREPVRALLRAGLGPNLAALLVSGQALQRNDRWWQAFALGVVADHGQALAPGARDAFVRSTKATLAATPPGRAWLARHLTERGQVDEAIHVLGPRPFAAAHLEVRLPGEDALLASAVAGVLVATSRPSPGLVRRAEGARASDPLAALRDIGAQGNQQTALDRAKAWLARSSVSDIVLVAEQLAEQGHGQLAKLLLRDVLADDGPLALQAEWMLRALRVVAAVADRAETLDFAQRCVAAPAAEGALFDRAARRRELADRLMDWGHPEQARELLTSRRRVPAITSVWVSMGDEGTTFADGALRRFDPQALAQVPTGVPAAIALEAFRVHLARGAADAALQLARSTLDHEDEPWHMRGVLVAEALRWRADEVARTLLRGARKDAPEGAFGCVRLALAEGSVEGCLRGRPAIVLLGDEIAAIVDAVGRGDPTARTVVVEVAGAGDYFVQSMWMGLLAARLGAAAPEVRRRGAEAALALLGAMPNGARSHLSSTSLDELAALGVPELAVQECTVAYQAEPHDHGSQNNLAYARLMAGASPADVLPMATAALVSLSGANAFALLDTLGAMAVAAGEFEAAHAWQRASVASVPERVPPSLPYLRLAEIELRLGRVVTARELAAWVLARGKAGPYVDERARAVILASFRGQGAAGSGEAPSASSLAPTGAAAPTPATAVTQPKVTEGLPAP